MKPASWPLWLVVVEEEEEEAAACVETGRERSYAESLLADADHLGPAVVSKAVGGRRVVFGEMLVAEVDAMDRCDTGLEFAKPTPMSYGDTAWKLRADAVELSVGALLKGLAASV